MATAVATATKAFPAGQEMLFYYEAIWPPSSSPGEEGETSPTADSLVDLFAVVFGAGGFVFSFQEYWEALTS